MGKTTLTQTQVRSDTLTGASINDFLGIYDETDNYSVGNQVYWDRYIWECVNAVTAGTPGDLANAPDVSADWERAPYIPAVVSVSANYASTETWLLDILEVDTSGGNITVTLPLPATIATWDDGRQIAIFNVGSNTVSLDPNGNSLSGSTNTRIITSENDWIKIIKVNGELIILTSEINLTHIKARSWMGF